MEFNIKFSPERIFFSLLATVALIAILMMITGLIAALVSAFGFGSLVIIGVFIGLWVLVDRVLFKLKAYPSQV